MNNKKNRVLIVIVIVLGTMILMGGLTKVLAQIGALSSDSTSPNSGQPSAASVGQPDGVVNWDVASAGSLAGSDNVQEVAPASLPASNPGADENSGVTQPSSTGSGPSPSDKSGSQPQNSALGSQKGPTATFTYYNISAPGFFPRSSTTTLVYNNLGCTYMSNASDYAVANVHLPDGAVLKYLRVYYNVTSGSVTGWITKYDGGQHTLDLVNVTSNTTTGWNFIVSSEITDTVSNSAYSYVVNLKSNGAGATMQYCGARIAYYAPLTITRFLPMVGRTP
jgi:hypothetical protein